MQPQNQDAAPNIIHFMNQLLRNHKHKALQKREIVLSFFGLEPNREFVNSCGETSQRSSERLNLLLSLSG
jgi:hypothetical protein